MTTQAIQRPNTGLVSMDAWNTMRDQAAVLVKSGFLPTAINTPEKAVAVILKGHELGIPAMYALSNIIISNGKTTCNAELMLALIYRDHGDNAILFEESTPERCTVSYARRSWTTRKTHPFTMAEAILAGLPSGTNSATWKKYPAQMLRARCISAVARLAFADSIGGMYTPEELGAAIKVDEQTGEILTVQAVEIHEEQPASNRPQDNASAPAESRAGAGAQGRSPQPTNDATSLTRAVEGNTHETSDLESAWKEYRYLAPQAGYTTADAQKAHIQEVYPGRKPRDLTLAEVGVLVAICRQILDLPANDGAEQVA